MAAGSFRWVRSEVYPLIAVVVVGGVLSIYSMARHLWTNPEVFPTKAYRQEGVPETPESSERAKGYEQAIFRALQQGRRQPEDERPNTRIF
ncbi:hypothetical protein CHLNCDRAFT_141626 [Chlorella variabilis]|uniref:Uncharacterized protein n=1 Tax=Chlorella variabilis TaxID=554065 RepID=E1ZT71_CHLVA|nr:hypothetical protein CHLNCDRAFT_141626 [Chlorella variabilis]EFN50978.1 hypothetical protein CHLNCDRAFT_141626 [Chlorella variabilis]|eukprot:XP_005843080.1 hypothetical protein CHLNCDRAFT_141626 [Chlorella variabilis]